ncbi:P-loop containing nucleoside triphosphate hydrolase protein [Gongronella butleri]|nr:P-loop containing nucleoside triphosphate hydrolase protein [Gongronella butleri]
MSDQHLMEESVTFASFDLDPRLSRAIAQLQFVHPTLIQAKAIPLALAGKDILARARTGAGKTAAYTLPIVQKILAAEQEDERASTKALILVPTRELAEQVTSHVKRLLVFTTLKVANLAGHMAPQLQRPMLAEKPDILISTPSKVLAHLDAKNLDLQALQTLVIDEADLVLSFGYEEDLRKIIASLPKMYQSFLMSATFTEDVEQLKKLVLRKPVILKLEEEEKDDPHQLTQYVVHCAEVDKFLYTFVMVKLRLLRGKVIFFVNDIDRCYRLKLFLEQFSIKSCVLNSELPINSRYHIVEEFNRGIYNYLIATDESDLQGEADTDDEQEEEQEEDEQERKKKKKKASKIERDQEYGVSRGVDFMNVAAVINFDFPGSTKAYTHRVGRTARGGKQGMALSFVVDAPDALHPALTRKNADDATVFGRVEKKQQDGGRQIAPYTFDKKNVDGFRYRVEDALRTINAVAIKEARITEIKREILNSDKLKMHFEDKPRDLEFLRHDQALQPNMVRKHLQNIPAYLMPKINGQRAMNNSEEEDVGPVYFKKQTGKRPYGKSARGGSRGGAQAGRGGKNPLKKIRRR